MRGSMTTATPESALAAFTCAAKASWAAHWMSRSMVSRTSLPGTALVMRSSGVGIWLSSIPRWNVDDPATPASVRWSASSMPPSPSPSSPAKPMTLDATSPEG